MMFFLEIGFTLLIIGVSLRAGAKLYATTRGVPYLEKKQVPPPHISLVLEIGLLLKLLGTAFACAGLFPLVTVTLWSLGTYATGVIQ
jgi:hypothetical protein